MHSSAAFNEEVLKRYEEWMVVQHYTARTKQTYWRKATQFIDYLKDKSLASVTHLDVRTYIAHLSEQGASMSNAYDHLLVLRRFYDFLNLGGLVEYVAPRLVRMRDAPRKIPRVLSEHEVRRFLAAAFTLREKALVEFLYGTGCRVSEVVSLRVENIDFDSRTALVSGKGRRGRIVLVTERALHALRNYIADRKKGYVFQPDAPVQKATLSKCTGHWIGTWKDYRGPGRRYVSTTRYLGSSRLVTYAEAKIKLENLTRGVNLVRPKTDGPLSTNAIRILLNRIGDRTGLRHVSPHVFRHTFATHLLDHGADLADVQALLGHAFIQTTTIYAHVSRKRLVKMFERCHPGGLGDGQISRTAPRQVLQEKQFEDGLG
jgi:site-specific recombinase XerD